MSSTTTPQGRIGGLTALELEIKVVQNKVWILIIINIDMEIKIVQNKVWMLIIFNIENINNVGREVYGRFALYDRHTMVIMSINSEIMVWKEFELLP